jgi:hypothetical protein
MGMFGNAFKPGGAGRDVAGYVGDALLRLSGGDPVYAPMKAQGLQQQQMLQREMQLAAYKAQLPQDPTMMQRNYEYLKQTRPDLAESYLRAEANPQTLMTDPMTGNLRFAPKGGEPMPSQPSAASKVINGKTYYNVNGDWYDNPEGR